MSSAATALLGHSKLNMVLRYEYPQEKHQAEAMKLLEAFNAAKEIAEFETLHTKTPTVPENPVVFVIEETEGKPSRIN